MKSGAIGFVVTLLIFAFLSVPPFHRGLIASHRWDPIQVKLIGSIVSSIAVGLFAIVIILFKKDEADKRWAYGILGTIVGYWLPSPLQ